MSTKRMWAVIVSAFASIVLIMGSLAISGQTHADDALMSSKEVKGSVNSACVMLTNELFQMIDNQGAEEMREVFQQRFEPGNIVDETALHILRYYDVIERHALEHSAQLTCSLHTYQALRKATTAND